jgi:hypothetical protein
LTVPAAVGNATNITAFHLNYYQQSASTQQGWNAAILTFWNVLLGIVVVAAVLITVLKLK